MCVTGRPGLVGELSARQWAADGAIFCSLLSAVILGSLYHNPQIWFSDYPPELQAQADPPSTAARRQRRWLGPLFLILFFGGLVASNLRLKQRNGGRLSFRAGLIHAYTVSSAFNLCDALVIDYLVLTRLQPRFAQLPGTEGLDPARYVSGSQQFQNWLKGGIFSGVAALPVAALTRTRSRL